MKKTSLFVLMVFAFSLAFGHDGHGHTNEWFSHMIVDHGIGILTGIAVLVAGFLIGLRLRYAKK